MGSPERPKATGVALREIGRRRFVLVAPAHGPFEAGTTVRPRDLAGRRIGLAPAANVNPERESRRWSNRSAARRRTSPAAAWPTRSVRSGRPR
ncbi:hypothetical protein [Amycolatopsis sp. NPDC051903]|uniref:hypothetical protein n=1 Tax=Amycolatopsis sp. NPDC051903 TaxID=3363936 RepID=UPI0037970A7B